MTLEKFLKKKKLFNAPNLMAQKISGCLDQSHGENPRKKAM
jgi:hypothetical protein